MKKWLTAIALLVWLPLAGAAIDARPFEDPEQEDRYRQLTEELRCTVCQNQNLADSNAELAVDLRRKVYEMVQDGKSNDEITGYMVARYGDFVLYRPPMEPATYFLWFGPALLLVIGSVSLLVFVRRRMAANAVDSDELSSDERQRLERLTGADRKKGGQ
ncbi:cytochrome c-type biogenesis protein [Thiohalomonas denitrificans]|uniref:Cytochrome c-type biogenesis protein n=1 Tax=Thiohalomonas denitrificans TaxID=415747 RepID=A0A1G5Q801_9GAMM|nr:cytochrome c-type biogenesis protein [Thiohalomonas denitrificans]SCZ57973.1 cytochrome c-type biogenesis protein CcmH [Thiohalomonas denitrificans]